MADSNAEIQTLVDDFARQIQALAKKSAIEQVIAALGGAGGQPRSAAKRGPGRPKGSTNKVQPAASSPKAAPSPTQFKSARKGQRRTAADVERMGQVLIDFVKANPGQRADQIAKALRTDPGTMRLPMQALLSARKVKTQGQRRGTKYFIAGSVPSASAAPKANPAKKTKKNQKKSAKKKSTPAKKARRATRKPRSNARKIRAGLVRLSARGKK